MKKYIKSLLFLGFAIILFVFCYWDKSMYGSIYTMELNNMMREYTSGYQVRQMLSVIGLYMLGGFTLYNVNGGLSTKWLMILAYPLGILIWIVCSVLLLILGIPYRLSIMLFLVCVIEVVLYLKNKGKHCYIQEKDILINGVIICAGVLCLASTGLFFTYSSHDTGYFIEILGKVFAVEKELKAYMSTYLMETGIGVATLSSLAYMCGFDNIYIIQQCLVINFWVVIYCTLYEKQRDKKGIVKSCLGVFFIASVTGVTFLLGWIISNAYIMVFIFIVFVILSWINEKKYLLPAHRLILVFVFACIPLFRAEGALITFCVLVCMATMEVENKEVICYCILPGAVMQMLWYIKIYIVLSGKMNSYIFSYKTALAMLALYFVTFLYYGFIRNKRWFFISSYFNKLLFGEILVISVVLLVLTRENIGTIWDVYVNNFTLMNIDGGVWGVSLVFIELLCLISYCKTKKQITFWELGAMLLIWSTVALSLVRGLMGNSARKGVGDSFNRMLLSYAPILIFCVYSRIMYTNKNENTVSER